MDDSVNTNSSIELIFPNGLVFHTAPNSTISKHDQFPDQFDTVINDLVAITNSEESKGTNGQQQIADSEEMPCEPSPELDEEMDDGESSIQPKFVCDKCGKIYHSKSSYKSHVDIVHNKILCTCHICGATMKYSTNLKAHMRAVHKIDEPILKKKFNRVCPKCKKTFKSNYLMYHHLQTVHGVEKPHQCRLCQARFRTSCELSGHQNIHPELAPYACNVCPCRYKTKGALEKHEKKFGHNKMQGTFQHPNRNTLECKKCKKVFASMQGYMLHVSNFDDRCSQSDQRHVCKCCGEVFKAELELESHFNENHQELKCPERNTTSVLECKQCKKAFASMQGYVYHVSNVACSSNDGRNVCKCCGEAFESQSELKIHFNENHQELKYSKPNVPSTLECKKCKKMFATTHSYVYHVSSFEDKCSSDEKCICKCCGEAFGNQLELKNHFYEKHPELEEVSKKARGKPCPVCKKILQSTSTIAYHAKMHAGIKPFKCDLCDYRTITAGDLAKHKRNIHEKIKNHPCQICCRKFYAKCDKISHHDFHLGMRRYKCNKCHKLFLTRDQCDSHQKLCKIGRKTTIVNPKDVVGYRCRWCGGLFPIAAAYSVHKKSCHLKDNLVDIQIPEKQELEKAYNSILQQDEYKGYSKQAQTGIRTDLLPWCKICGAIYVNQGTYKFHSYYCTTETRKIDIESLFDQKSSTDENYEGKDQGAQEDTEEQVMEQTVKLELPKPNKSAVAKPGPDQSVFNDPSVLDKPISDQSDLAKSRSDQSALHKSTETLSVLDKPNPGQSVLIKPKPKQTVLNKCQSDHSYSEPILTRPEQPVLHNSQTGRTQATNKVFSPFSYSCGACRDVTEELIKEFCSEHYTFCTYCRQVLRYDTNARLHLQGHLEKQEKPQADDQLVCKTCRKTTKELIQAHICRHPYHCLPCLLAFDCVKKLSNHAKKHNVVKSNFPCSQCDRVFTQKPKLNKHLRQYHPQDLVFLDKGMVKYKVVCQYCPEKFKNKIDKNRHEQSAHYRGPTYKCCGKYLNTYEKYKKHQASKQHIRFVNRCDYKPSTSHSEDVEMDEENKVVISGDWAGDMQLVKDNADSTESVDIAFHTDSPSPEMAEMEDLISLSDIKVEPC